VKEHGKWDDEPSDCPKPTSPWNSINPDPSFAKSMFDLHREGMQLEVQERLTVSGLSRNANRQFVQ
jgi:hypothetical protein